MRERRIRPLRTKPVQRDRIYLYLEPDIADRVRAYAEFTHLTPSGAARELVNLGLEWLERREDPSEREASRG
jgi:hypothetical protein